MTNLLFVQPTSLPFSSLILKFTHCLQLFQYIFLKETQFLFHTCKHSCNMFLEVSSHVIFSVINLSIKLHFSSYQGLVWLKDKEATHCKLCEKEFSLSKRKVREVESTKVLVQIWLFSFSDFFFLPINSTTVETVGKFSVMLALTTNCRCLLHQSQCGFVIPVMRC